jgi:hypothetical protein
MCHGRPNALKWACMNHLGHSSTTLPRNDSECYPSLRRTLGLTSFVDFVPPTSRVGNRPCPKKPGRFLEDALDSAGASRMTARCVDSRLWFPLLSLRGCGWRGRRAGVAKDLVKRFNRAGGPEINTRLTRLDVHVAKQGSHA